MGSWFGGSWSHGSWFGGSWSHGRTWSCELVTLMCKMTAPIPPTRLHDNMHKSKYTCGHMIYTQTHDGSFLDIIVAIGNTRLPSHSHQQLKLTLSLKLSLHHQNVLYWVYEQSHCTCVLDSTVYVCICEAISFIQCNINWHNQISYSRPTVLIAHRTEENVGRRKISSREWYQCVLNKNKRECRDLIT